jgi:hypothetical protein
MGIIIRLSSSSGDWEPGEAIETMGFDASRIQNSELVRVMYSGSLDEIRIERWPFRFYWRAWSCGRGVNRASLLSRRVRGHVTAIEREMKAENNIREKEVSNI